MELALATDIQSTRSLGAWNQSVGRWTWCLQTRGLAMLNEGSRATVVIPDNVPFENGMGRAIPGFWRGRLHGIALLSPTPPAWTTVLDKV